MKKYKIKTRKIVAKRFKVTGTGKILRRSQNMRHLRRRKTKKQIRAYKVPKVVSGKQAAKIKHMLAI
jgi:large subunit ribosomal protein L35